MYLNFGDETTPEEALGFDLGDANELSSKAFEFEINSYAGTRYTFSMTPMDGTDSVSLCWGHGCPEFTISATRLGGYPPAALGNYNGLQIQLRAQEVQGSSAELSNLRLTGVDISDDSAPLLEAFVYPDSPSTIPLDPPGRLGQWILGAGLSQVSWSPSGRITLTRPDDAVAERSKVRLAIDFVRDLRLN
jgi:hypothetical protein